MLKTEHVETSGATGEPAGASCPSQDKVDSRLLAVICFTLSAELLSFPIWGQGLIIQPNSLAGERRGHGPPALQGLVHGAAFLALWR